MNVAHSGLPYEVFSYDFKTKVFEKHENYFGKLEPEVTSVRRLISIFG
jgi:hypothetical protein